ncbi:MAG: Crp/Fnr family transcriptional regulator [Sulfurimonadaceae bacterium]|jgi:CRP/FNR family transcriptional regulator|nr:Crp/Fnr family transcriptional regulator [Sulfurimonadaceae bacterium]
MQAIIIPMIINDLRRLDLFKDLQEQKLAKIAAITTIKTFNEGNILFYEGEHCEYFYLLLDGALKLYKTGIKANEIVLHYFVQPTLVAEMASLESVPFPATASVMKPSTRVALIDQAKFLELLLNDAELSFFLVKSLTKKIKTLEVAINRNLVFDATLKVCSMIQEEPDVFATHKHKDIALLLNMAPETLSRIVQKLKKFGILSDVNILTAPEKLELFLEFK